MKPVTDALALVIERCSDEDGDPISMDIAEAVRILRFALGEVMAKERDSERCLILVGPIQVGHFEMAPGQEITFIDHTGHSMVLRGGTTLQWNIPTEKT